MLLFREENSDASDRLPAQDGVADFDTEFIVRPRVDLAKNEGVSILEVQKKGLSGGKEFINGRNDRALGGNDDISTSGYHISADVIAILWAPYFAWARSPESG